MKRVGLIIGLLLSVAFIFQSCDQKRSNVNQDKVQESKTEFERLKDSVIRSYDGYDKGKGSGWAQITRWLEHQEMRQNVDGKLFNSDVKSRLAMKRYIDNYSGAVGGGWELVGPNSWIIGPQGYGPGMGRVCVINMDPNNSNNLYAGTPCGGLWRSTTGGNAWDNLTDTLGFMCGVAGVLIDPNSNANGNPGSIIILTGDGNGKQAMSHGIYQSTDNGTSWQTTSLVFDSTEYIYARKLIADPSDFQHQIATTSKGIYVTTNGWSTQQKVYSGSTFDIKFNPANGNVVYVSGPNVVLKSTNGGSNWDTIPSSTGLPNVPKTLRVELAVHPSDTSLIYALYANGSNGSGKKGFYGLYLSTDGGQNFRSKSDTPNIVGSIISGLDNSAQIPYDLAMTLDPSDPSLVYVGAVNTWLGVDSGSKWSCITDWHYKTTSGLGYNHADVHWLEFFNGQLFSASDGGVHSLSTTNDTDWTDLSFGLPITMVYHLTGNVSEPNVIYYGAQDNGVNKFNTTSTDQSKYLVITGDGYEVAINPDDTNEVYASVQYGKISRSDNNFNGGKRTNNLTGIPSKDSNANRNTPFQINPMNSNTIFIAYRKLIASYDKGSSWTPRSMEFKNPISLFTVAPSDTSIIYVVVNNRSVVKNVSGGSTSKASWVSIQNGLDSIRPPISDLLVNPTNEKEAWLSFSGFIDTIKVFHTVNGGKKWENISAGLPNVPGGGMIYANGNLYLGMDMGVYQKTSTGWQLFNSNLPMVSISEFYYDEAANFLYAGTYGRGIWKTSLD